MTKYTTRQFCQVIESLVTDVLSKVDKNIVIKLSGKEIDPNGGPAQTNSVAVEVSIAGVVIKNSNIFPVKSEIESGGYCYNFALDLVKAVLPAYFGSPFFKCRFPSHYIPQPFNF